ncbi:hypothetical protein GALL_09400 [mine drainage metagenome]|uniref:Uncharacterized protein n=1 Tax=mine drainage metagenome TaxID=410659 RepID=A0A1J5TER1_9ZZZZ
MQLIVAHRVTGPEVMAVCQLLIARWTSFQRYQSGNGVSGLAKSQSPSHLSFPDR